MNTSSARLPRISRVKCFTALMLLVFAVAVLAVPVISVNSRSASLKAPDIERTPTAPQNIAHQKSWMLSLPSMAFAGETVEVFAADCVTPKAAFNLGETVCAKTDGVDLTVPGNYYMNWVDSQLNQTNGGTITQNPQYFLFVPPTTGGWKATIGRVAPADSSIIGNPPIFTVNPGPAISTFASDCTTPKTTFTVGNGILPGDTVCARVAGVDPTFNRRFAWVDPAGNIRKFTAITSDPQTDSFTLPAEEFDTTYQVDNRGVWKVNVVSSRGSVVLTASFNVQGQAPAADLSVGKSKTSGDVVSGQNVTFNVSVYNRGPNDAQNVVLTDNTPQNASFSSVTQTSGPSFSCTGTTTVTCTGSILKTGDLARFEFVYTAGSAGSTITNTATVSSDTAETNSSDNSATDGPYTIGAGGGGGGDCELTCPSDITATANTTENGERGAHVNYAPAQSTGTCGTITYSHASGSFFPVGDTAVTATSETGGGSCTFRIRVEEPGNTNISCPANKEADADSSCEATVNVGAPTASGENVTFYATRSDGKPMYTCDANGNCTRNASDAPFAAGTTVITWFAYSHDQQGPYTTPGSPNPDGETFEEQHRTGSASCTQTVKVNDVTPPNIAATDSTVSADENCSAVIPDYSSTVTDNCACGSADDSEACEGHPHIVYTQTPAAGTVVGPGAHNVHIEATDGSENNNGATKDVTFTVEDTTAPAITCPANIETGTDPGVCSATVDPGTATATDNCDTSPTITGTRSDSQALNAPYPKGTTTITWRATDDEGNYSECTQTVTVRDDEAPVITFNGQTPSMWPPNHSYHTFTAANFISSVSDNCDSLSISDVNITKVTSDEAEESLTLGDGTTFNDIVIAANCKSVQLRAERVNTGNGRVYTIYFKLVDSSGNVTTGTAKVYSPKNQGDTPGDDAPQYTVTSACP